MTDARLRRATLVLALLVSVAALIGVRHRAAKGRNALLKWAPAQEALAAGEPIYRTGSEGYPTLPLSLLVLAPFHAAGPILGPLLWAALGVGLAWWIVLAALGLGAGRPRDAPGWVALAVLLVCGRVLHSEVQHANLNLLVGGVVVAAFVAWRAGRPLGAGLCLGLGAVLKVTPALGLVWLLRKRSARGLAGLALGLVLFGLVVPALWLGWARNLELAGEWWRQMIAPYVAGRAPDLLQTEHVNQSLYGVLARHLTDAVAIPARPPVHPVEVRLGWLHLAPATFLWVHRAAVGAVLGWLLLRLRPRGERAGAVVLGEAALVALAMLLVSERSWKHHHVLLPLPLVFLMLVAARADPRSARRRGALAAAGLAGALVALTGAALLGAAGSDLAEALGAFGLADLVLFAAVGALLPAVACEVRGTSPDARPPASPRSLSY